jgi:hypothetical protein
MKASRAKTLILVAALAALPVRFRSQAASTPSIQATSPSNTQTPSTNSPKPKPKKPDEPINPDATAGVRGAGSVHTVRVLLKGKPADGAHVVVKNTNGTLAASCDTSDSGECQVDLGADSYLLIATRHARAGTVSMPVDDATGLIVINLVKAASSAPKPQTP